MVTVFMDSRGPIIIDFVEKYLIKNSDSHCQLYLQDSSNLLITLVISWYSENGFTIKMNSEGVYYGIA